MSLVSKELFRARAISCGLTDTHTHTHKLSQCVHTTAALDSQTLRTREVKTLRVSFPFRSKVHEAVGQPVTWSSLG
eukprot:6482096-Amphidinium_carterae.1